MPALEINHQLFYWDLQETFRFSCKSQSSFRTFAIVLLWMAGDESLAR